MHTGLGWTGRGADLRAWTDLHYVPKYNRYEKRHKNLAAHCSPAFRVEVGDNVTVGQCRPLSKTVRYVPWPSRSECRKTGD